MNNVKYADYVRDRVLDVAKYTLLTKSNIRSTAKKFFVSKSTIHKDLTERLPNIKPQIAIQVKNILEINKTESTIRGGLATKRKYKKELL